MIVLAIDPGSHASAFVVFNSGTDRIRSFGKVANESLLAQLRGGVSREVEAVVIEWMTPRGMPTSAQEFETLWWAGRFTEAVEGHRFPVPVARQSRLSVKRHLCGKVTANDTNIRAALIDRFGGAGGKEVAIGRKAEPGPLYGIAADAWAALALAVTYVEAPE